MDIMQTSTGASAMASSYSSSQASSVPKKTSESVASFGRLETAVIVTKKANDIFKEQGKAILDLIDSATAVSNASGANAGGNSSSTTKGTALNILA